MGSQSSPPCYKPLNRVVFVTLLLSLLVHSGISSNTWYASLHHSRKTQLPPIYTIDVVNEHPHDPQAFTEGLLYGGNDTLYESTGLYGKSSVRRVTLQTGKVDARQEMASSYFGEGLSLIGERLYQLTWLHKTGFIYDKNNLSRLDEFTHEMNDGWGLATDGKFLFGSDGSSTIYQIDPQTMKVIQKQIVKYNDLEVPYLNELEFVNGEVWANIFTTDCIVRISPGDGTILGWVSLGSLRKRLIEAGEIRYQDVLNGIAWDSDGQRLFVTGKNWPRLFEIKVHPIPMEQQVHVDIKQLCIRKVALVSKT